MHFRPCLTILMSLLLCQSLISQEAESLDFTLTVISGDERSQVEKAKRVIERARKIDGCKVKWERREGLDRIIGIYDGRFAGRVNGRETIEPIVREIAVDQPVAFYRGENSKLKIEELTQICDLLPWNPRELPDNVEFWTKFEDPITLGSFSSVVADKKWILGFLIELEEQVGPAGFIASAKLRSKDSEQPEVLLVIGFEKDTPLNTENIQLPIGKPAKIVVVGSYLVWVPSPDSEDVATNYLKKWSEKLVKQHKKLAVQSEPNAGD